MKKTLLDSDNGVKAPNKYFCPKCKMEAGVDIIYGMPSGLGLGVKLGGCVIKVGQPNRHCFNCGYEWKSEELKQANRQIKEQDWKERVKQAKDLGDEEWLIGKYMEEDGPFSRARQLREKKSLMLSSEDLGEHEKIERKKAAEWRQMVKNQEAAHDEKMKEFEMRRAQCEEDNKQSEKLEKLIIVIVILVALVLVLGFRGDHPNYSDSSSESYGKYGREE